LESLDIADYYNLSQYLKVESSSPMDTMRERREELVVESGLDVDHGRAMLDNDERAVGHSSIEGVESGGPSAAVLLERITPDQFSISGFSTLSPESNLYASDGNVPIHNLYLIVHSPLIKEIMNTLSDITEAVIIIPDFTKSDLVVLVNMMSGRAEYEFVKGEMLDALGMTHYKTLVALTLTDSDELRFEGGEEMDIAYEITIGSAVEDNQTRQAVETIEYQRNPVEQAETANNMYECEICKQKMKTKITLKQHMNNKHSSDPSVALQLKEIAAKKSLSLKCILCQKLFNTRQIKEHIRLMHPEVSTDVKCGLCNQQFSNMSHLNRHKMMVHENLRKFQCEFCDFKTKLKETLKEHVKIHDGMWIVCERCGYKTKRQRDLQKHACKIKEFSCEQCGVKTASKAALRKHRQRKHT
jgi:hypothetical protein